MGSGAPRCAKIARRFDEIAQICAEIALRCAEICRDLAALLGATLAHLAAQVLPSLPGDRRSGGYVQH